MAPFPPREQIRVDARLNRSGAIVAAGVQKRQTLQRNAEMDVMSPCRKKQLLYIAIYAQGHVCEYISKPCPNWISLTARLNGARVVTLSQSDFIHFTA